MIQLVLTVVSMHLKSLRLQHHLYIVPPIQEDAMTEIAL